MTGIGVYAEPGTHGRGHLDLRAGFERGEGVGDRAPPLDEELEDLGLAGRGGHGEEGRVLGTGQADLHVLARHLERFAETRLGDVDAQQGEFVGEGADLEEADAMERRRRLHGGGRVAGLMRWAKRSVNGHSSPAPAPAPRRTVGHRRAGRAHGGLLLVLLLSSLAGCGRIPGGDDGGTGGGADGGAGDAGPPPVFVEPPALSEVGPHAATLSFSTDLPTRATVQWVAAGVADGTTLEPPARVHRYRIAGLPAGRTLRVVVAAQAPGGSTVAEVEARTALLRSGGVVLFDEAHGQRAGSADWVSGGAYSDFATALEATGRFEVTRLTEGRFDDAGLQAVDVVVVPEPNTPLAASEWDALERFVRRGGGLVLVANHGGADRDNDGFDAVSILRAFLDRPGVGLRLTGDRVNGPAYPEPDDPLADGPFGVVEAAGAFEATTVTVTGENPGARVHLRIPRAGPLVASVPLGEGRVVVHGDSAAADDGSGSGGAARPHDAWNDPQQDNAALFGNMVSWAAGEY